MSTSSPRLICRIARFRIALSPHATFLAAGHCENCAACQAYFASSNQLETDLRQNAAQSVTLPPSGLERRILESLTAQKAPRQPARPQISWAMVAVGTGLALAVGFFQLQKNRPQHDESKPVTVQDVVTLAQQFPKAWLGRLPPETARLIQENPLQTEISSVRSDASSALNFLALNFLPTPNKGNAPEHPPAENSGSS